jgi:hypothetical protein
MTKTEITGSIKSGVIQLNNFTRKRLQDDLRQFEDCDIQIVIKRKGKRSSQANRFYWGALLDTAVRRMRELGNKVTPEEMHEYFKMKFNPTVFVGAGGVMLEGFGGSTTEMNVSEFAEYCNNIIEWIWDNLEVRVDQPGTQTEMPFMIATYDQETKTTIVKRA